MVVARPATPFPSHHHSLDQSVALPDQTLGRDDVLVGRQSNGPRLREDSTILDSRHAYAGHPRFDLRDQSSFGQRTARALRWKTDTTIVLLDRSPSMQERGENGIDSKFTTAKRQLRETLQTLGSNRWVLIDSAQQKPQEFQSVADLFDAPSAQPSSASADLPGMLQTAIEYLKNNRPGQTEIWICSDLRQSDWNSNSNQWSAVRDAFRQFPQTVRLQLISYAENSSENVSIRVTDVRRETVDGSQALVVILDAGSRREGQSNQGFPRSSRSQRCAIRTPGGDDRKYA